VAKHMARVVRHELIISEGKKKKKKRDAATSQEATQATSRVETTHDSVPYRLLRAL
jgi:hypothetical protein